MRIYNLRQVKKEIRTLGLAAKPTGVDDKLYVVGVVFRGKLWLDGVMKAVACGPDITKEVVEMIINSPHYPQIRVILLHGDLLEGESSVDPCILSSQTSRPVIALKFDEGSLRVEDAEHVSWFKLKKEGTSISSLSVGLTNQVAIRVLEMIWRDGSLPEGLRVAGLVVSALTEELT
jgi:endonuclease V-like protein UPF0215 family